jgi:Domain of unknown function (DUF4307)
MGPVTAPPTLEERYGSPSRGSRVAVIAGSVVVAVVFLTWLGWTVIAQGDPDVSSDLVSFDVVDDHHTTARIAVRLGDDDVVATCVLRATAEDHTTVGELSFEVTADDLANGDELEREIRTERRATTVEAIGCTTPDQPRPR